MDTRAFCGNYRILSQFASFSFLFRGVQRGCFSFPGGLICRLTCNVVGSQLESDIDQPDEHWQFEHRSDNSDKCLAGVSPKTANAIAIANSKLFRAAVKENVAD